MDFGHLFTIGFTTIQHKSIDWKMNFLKENITPEKQIICFFNENSTLSSVSNRFWQKSLKL